MNPNIQSPLTTLSSLPSFTTYKRPPPTTRVETPRPWSRAYSRPSRGPASDCPIYSKSSAEGLLRRYVDVGKRRARAQTLTTDNRSTFSPFTSTCAMCNEAWTTSISGKPCDIPFVLSGSVGLEVEDAEVFWAKQEALAVVDVLAEGRRENGKWRQYDEQHAHAHLHLGSMSPNTCRCVDTMSVSSADPSLWRHPTSKSPARSVPRKSSTTIMDIMREQTPANRDPAMSSATHQRSDKRRINACLHS